MYKILFFVLTLFFLAFPSFLTSSSERNSKNASSEVPSQSQKHFENTFSFQPTTLEKKIFKKPKNLFLKGKIEKAFSILKNFSEAKIRKMVFPKKSFFQKIILKKRDSSNKEKEQEKIYEKLILLRSFALGLFSYESGKWDKAIYYFQRSSLQNARNFKENQTLSPYIHFFLGQSYLNKKLYNEAEEELKKIQKYELPYNMQSQRLFSLSSIYIENKNWSQAKKL